MTTLRMILIGAGGLLIVSCNSGDKSELVNDAASGVYVREYSIEISNPNTGEKLGIRQVRDSIFIKQSDGGFEVSNRKWRMNDYDQEGWVSMAHADDRPMSTFVASYDQNTRKLDSKSPNVPYALFVDGGKLFRNESRDIEYKKVN
jgi:hypothetical protein